MPKRLLHRLRNAIEKALRLDGLGLDFETNPDFIDMSTPDGSGVKISGFEMYFAGLGGLLDADMPGKTYSGPIRLTDEEKAVQDRLHKSVTKLADDIGPRNTRRIDALNAAANFITDEFKALGLQVFSQGYTTSDGYDVRNIEAILPGAGMEGDLVIGAHYDTVDCPGADDNTSGVACLLEIAREMASVGRTSGRAVRLVAFTNEEPPYFYSDDMGSRVYADALKRSGEKLLGMVCLESLGYFSDEPGSQQIPPVLTRLFSRSAGDFIGFFSDMRSREFLKTSIGAFRRYAEIPSFGLAASSIVKGIDFSDHESFQRFGFNSLVVTDTAFMRNPHYHTSGDTTDTLDWIRLTKVTTGLIKLVKHLVM